MRQIADFPLWLGHVGDSRDLRAILAAGILAVVDLAMNEAPAHVTRELVYCRFPLFDGVGNPPWLIRTAVDCVAGLIRSGKPTLVYCSNGMNRSPCIAAAAIARAKGLTFAAALALVVEAGAADIAPGLWSEVLAALS